MSESIEEGFGPPVGVVDRAHWLTCGKAATVLLGKRKVTVPLPAGATGTRAEVVMPTRIEATFVIHSGVDVETQKRSWTVTSLTVTGISAARTVERPPLVQHTGEISYTWEEPELTEALRWLPPFVGATLTRWLRELNELARVELAVLDHSAP